jgi:hypothetical protein
MVKCLTYLMVMCLIYLDIYDRFWMIFIMNVYSTVQVQPVFVVFHSTWDIDLCGLLFITRQFNNFFTYMTLQYKHSTQCIMNRSLFFFLFLKLLQINFVLADNVHILSICESSQFRTEYLRYCFDSTDDTIQEGNPSVHK